LFVSTSLEVDMGAAEEEGKTLETSSGKKIWLIGKGSLIMNIGGRNIWERVGTNRTLLELRAAPWGLNFTVQKVAPRTL
jgi:hypothetical protein